MRAVRPGDFEDPDEFRAFVEATQRTARECPFDLLGLVLAIPCPAGSWQLVEQSYGTRCEYKNSYGFMNWYPPHVQVLAGLATDVDGYLDALERHVQGQGASVVPWRPRNSPPTEWIARWVEVHQGATVLFEVAVAFQDATAHEPPSRHSSAVARLQDTWCSRGEPQGAPQGVLTVEDEARMAREWGTPHGDLRRSR